MNFLDNGSTVSEISQKSLRKLRFNCQHPAPVFLYFPATLIGQNQLDDGRTKGTITMSIRKLRQIVIRTYLFFLQTAATHHFVFTREENVLWYHTLAQHTGDVVLPVQEGSLQPPTGITDPMSVPVPVSVPVGVECSLLAMAQDVATVLLWLLVFLALKSLPAVVAVDAVAIGRGSS